MQKKQLVELSCEDTLRPEAIVYHSYCGHHTVQSI